MPNTDHYDGIRNRTGTSLAVSNGSLDDKYNVATKPGQHFFDTPRRISSRPLPPHDNSELGMYEPQRAHLSLSSFPSNSSASRSSCVPPPAPRPKCCELPFVEDDFYDETDTTDDGVYGVPTHIETHDWSHSLPSPLQTPFDSPELGPVDKYAPSTQSNALWLDLSATWCNASSAFGASRFRDDGRLGEPDHGPRSAPPMSVSPGIEFLSALSGSEPSDNQANVTSHVGIPEKPFGPPLNGQGGATPRGRCAQATDEQPENRMTASNRPPIQYLDSGIVEGAGQTPTWASDRDVVMYNEPLEDDLGDDWNDAPVYPYGLSPPSLDESSDLDSDTTSVHSPPESAVLFSGSDPRAKLQGYELWQFSQLEDDLGDDDEVIMTPMEEAPYALHPVRPRV